MNWLTISKKLKDVQLGMMVEIVRKYGNRIPGIIQEIKAKHIDNDEKENAQNDFFNSPSLQGNGI